MIWHINVVKIIILKKQNHHKQKEKVNDKTGEDAGKLCLLNVSNKMNTWVEKRT